MLINAGRAGHLRVAVIDGTTLEEYQVEMAEADLCRGNIYRGVVANIQPSLNAAFVDIGEERHGFLPVGDILPSAYHRKPPEDQRRPRIDQVLERGRSILVQVTKDGVGNKGPALTTNLALAGRYLVMMPFDDVRGISRKIEDDEARAKLRERLSKLNLKEDSGGVIVRTNGLDQNQTTLNRDLSALQRLWKSVYDESRRGKGPRLLYSDQDLIVQALRDYLDSSIEQVIVDDDEAYAKADNYMQAFMPRSKTRLIRYQDRLPLFSRHHLEQQIGAIYDRTVSLPSGGSIVIDGTEALTAIDVNSGRATRVSDYEESILKVNVEAAHEVARQLRLRDIGGLLVVDFIDMRLRKHQRRLEKELRDAMKVDRARHSIGRLSSNGLIEINRQRMKQALRLRTHRPCPTCAGVGNIASPEFAAQSLLRRIEARLVTGTVQSAMVALHPSVADALQNNHRAELAALERDFDTHIEIISAPEQDRAEERIEWTQREARARSAEKAPSTAVTATDITAKSNDRRRRKSGDESRTSDEDSSRRRPSRRRRSSAADNAAQEAASEDQDDAKEVEAAEAKDDDNEKSNSSRSRRRRRGGRRRRKPAAEKSEDKGQEKAAQASEKSDEPDGNKAPRQRRGRRGDDQAASQAAGNRGRNRNSSSRDGNRRSSSASPGNEALHDDLEPPSGNVMSTQAEAQRRPRWRRPPLDDEPEALPARQPRANTGLAAPRLDDDHALDEPTDNNNDDKSRWVWWRRRPLMPDTSTSDESVDE